MALAPFPSKQRVLQADGTVQPRGWGEWFRALMLAVNGETGEWSPIDGSGAGLTFTTIAGNCVYFKLGAMVQASFRIVYPATADGSAAVIGGLPFLAENTPNSIYAGAISFTDEATLAHLQVRTNTQVCFLWTAAGVQLTNATMSGNELRGTLTYRAAS